MIKFTRLDNKKPVWINPYYIMKVCEGTISTIHTQKFGTYIETNNQALDVTLIVKGLPEEVVKKVMNYKKIVEGYPVYFNKDIDVAEYYYRELEKLAGLEDVE